MDVKREEYRAFEGNPLALIFEFKHSRSIIDHKREIYGILDLLGDVGGLSDALFPIGSILISLLHLIAGNPFTSYLLNNIFEQDNSHKNVDLTVIQKLNLLQKRKPFKVKRLCCSRKSRMALDRGQRSIDKELDIVNFIRK